ncbi:2-amino-4-hydroxy-6-hydroxymethyldihydropteridine diphosphokinase [Thalassotalea ponticola]|uniref:2-amino-4-hydroxy-6- hydroxymethyldihydropteridine diphosphokinase n=1 Tax=Thalassotalea ponticola TaxID=1523392 RepID=UPI0025B3FE1F|nr:2-amino-4-hydroxy-6-hydroxymethyldihydropteridine diphosphokinase [Thalassotalea ponticola]MDN3651966.1 2-amino-4-hydroxy-6-hydroxymethyldihydropteridine diphosphokinase [Thalassotalea ponticola]
MAQVYISIGSNIERETQIVLAVQSLRDEFGAVDVSSVYECEPVGFSGENFYNLVAKVHTNKSPQYIGELLKTLEKQHGRVDFSKKFSPRKMDLDILLYDDLVMEQPVQLPRDEIPLNAYVLQPLAELAPDEVHPTLGQTYQQIWQQYDKTKQQVQRIDFTWPIALSH